MFMAVADGGANHNGYDFGQLRTSVREAGVQVYGIKIGEPWNYGTNVRSDIAEMTGERSPAKTATKRSGSKAAAATRGKKIASPLCPCLAASPRLSFHYACQVM
jgi:hypothetical protein